MRWDDFCMGSYVAIPVIGLTSPLVASNIVLTAGTYLEFGAPFVLSEGEMWGRYGAPVLAQKNRGDIEYESYDNVWANWDAEDEGAYLFANVGQTESRKYIHAYGDKGGNLWKWACGNAPLPAPKDVYPHFSTDNIRQLLFKANNSNGFGWAVLSIENIKVKSGEAITYGITTDPAITGEKSKCEWVSATDFVLTRTDTKPQE
jgi:hypothetical protein